MLHQTFGYLAPTNLKLIILMVDQIIDLNSTTIRIDIASSGRILTVMVVYESTIWLEAPPYQN